MNKKIAYIFSIINNMFCYSFRIHICSFSNNCLQSDLFGAVCDSKTFPLTSVQPAVSTKTAPSSYLVFS